MRDGDIYRWGYKQHIIDKSKDSVRAGTLYWGCSRIAMFSDGRLRDTYYCSDGRWWTEERAIEDLELTFIANENDLEKCNFPEYYEDIIDLTHPNSNGKKIYIRKGQKRSKKVMMQLIHDKMDKSLYKIESLHRDVERLEEKLDEVNKAEDLEEIWI